MPLPDLADLKAFARVDGDHEDWTLDTLLQSAVEFVQTATGQDFTVTAPDRARVAVMALAAHWFDNRLPVAEAVNVVPFHVRSLIHQLRNWEDPAVTEALAEEDPAP